MDRGDVGGKDFTFGATGIGFIAILSIVLAIVA